MYNCHAQRKIISLENIKHSPYGVFCVARLPDVAVFCPYKCVPVGMHNDSTRCISLTGWDLGAMVLGSINPGPRLGGGGLVLLLFL